MSFGGACIFLKVKYDINVFATISQIKTLNQTVNEEKKFDNIITEEDKASAQASINAQLENLITYSAEDGYKMSSAVPMKGTLKLTDKQVGALLKIILESSNSPKVNIGGNDLGFDILQVKFSEVETNVKSDVNIVAKIDASSLKEKFSSFPLNIIGKRIPSTLYVSATVTIQKGESPFTYTLTGKSLEINNLDAKQTESFIKTIDAFLKCGDAKTLCERVAKPFIDGLIGTEENKGFALSLKDVGATDFNFETTDGVNYFVVEKTVA
ncbi:MAG TPA: hypothetical protein DEV78_03765 [Clostridiales bacterium]|nr:hypothetical protein [Clostridiales bacterium]